MNITTVREDLSIRLPEEIAQRFQLRQGDQVALEEKGPLLLLRCVEKGHREPLQEFSSALEKLRAAVKRVGGISQKEIDEAIRKVRANETHQRD